MFHTEVNVDLPKDFLENKEKFRKVIMDAFGGLNVNNLGYGHYTCSPRLEWGSDSYNCSDENDLTKVKKWFGNKTGWNVNSETFQKWGVNDASHCKVYTEERHSFWEIITIFELYDDLDKILTILINKGYIWAYTSTNDTECVTDYYSLYDWLCLLLMDNVDKIRNDYINHLKMVIDKKEVKNMSLKIKKTDVMSVKEFEESDKGYDEIIIKLDVEKVKEYEKDYGVGFNAPYEIDGDDLVVRLSDQTIEFKAKAIAIDGLINKKCIPYDYIKEIVGVYYLTRE